MDIGYARLASDSVLLVEEAQCQLVMRARIDLRLRGGATGVRSARCESKAEHIGAGTTFEVACEWLSKISCETSFLWVSSGGEVMGMSGLVYVLDADDVMSDAGEIDWQEISNVSAEDAVLLYVRSEA